MRIENLDMQINVSPGKLVLAEPYGYMPEILQRIAHKHVCRLLGNFEEAHQGRENNCGAVLVEIESAIYQNNGKEAACERLLAGAEPAALGAV